MFYSFIFVSLSLYYCWFILNIFYRIIHVNPYWTSKMKWYSDFITSLLGYIVIHSVESWHNFERYRLHSCERHRHIHSHTRFYSDRNYRTDSIQWICVVIAIYTLKILRCRLAINLTFNFHICWNFCCPIDLFRWIELH